MRIKPCFAAAALLAGACASGAASAADVCIPAKQAEGLLLYVAPSLIAQVATICAPTLPAGALLRTGTARLTSKYSAESAGAWPQARDALKTLAGPDAAQLLDTDMGRTVVPTLVGPLVAKEIQAKDCPSINRVMTLIDPLPARNTAQLIVTILDLAGRKKPATSTQAFRICPNESPLP